MSDLLNSVVHAVVEIIMDDKKPAAEPEQAPIVPLTDAQHSSLLFRMYCILAALCFMIGSLTVVR